MIEDEKKHLREITVFQFCQEYSTNFASYILLSYYSVSQYIHLSAPYAIEQPFSTKRTIPGDRVRAAPTFENIRAIIAKEDYLIDSTCVESSEDFYFTLEIAREAQVRFGFYCFGPALYGLKKNNYRSILLDSFEPTIQAALFFVPFTLFLLLLAQPKK